MVARPKNKQGRLEFLKRIKQIMAQRRAKEDARQKQIQLEKEREGREYEKYLTSINLFGV